MTAHLSALALDEIAAGTTRAADGAHLDACPACRDRLDRIVRERDRTLADPRFHTTFAKLPVTRRRRRAAWVWGVPALAAAVAILVLVRPADDVIRTKGAASLVLERPDGSPAGELHPGDIVQLRAQVGDHAFAIIVQEDASGTTVLWPPKGSASGPVRAGEQIREAFRVSPGSATLVGVFSDQPIPLAAFATSTGPGIARVSLAVVVTE